MIQSSGVAQANRIGGGKQPELWVRGDDFVLVQQGQFAVNFQHPLDHEHYVGATGIIFVKHDCGVGAQGPRQNAFLEFSDLFAVF